VTLRARWVDAKSSLGDAKSSLGDAKSSLGDAKSSLGDGKADGRCFSSSTASTCFAAEGNAVGGGCQCHPTCHTCGYGTAPTGDGECLTCAEGLVLVPGHDGVTGKCEVRRLHRYPPPLEVPRGH
jgi:hypothetical protein